MGNDLKNKPSFFIVGAMKAGTSNLRSLLVQHPDIYLSEETGYFGALSTKKELKWYLEYFKYANLSQIKGDKSPNYYFYKNAAREIHSFNPKAKLIWVLREPISRAYSDYWFSIYRGKEYLSFEKAVALELKGQRSEFRHYLYRSDYSVHIQRYLEYFSLEQMLFINLDDMYSSPVEVSQQCFSFLNVDQRFEVVQNDSLKNPTYLPRSFYLNYLNTQLFEKSFPKVRVKFRNMLRKNVFGYPKLDFRINNELKEYFKTKVEKTQNIIDLDLSSWL